MFIFFYDGCGRGITEAREYKFAQGSLPLQMASFSPRTLCGTSDPGKPVELELLCCLCSVSFYLCFKIVKHECKSRESNGFPVF